MRTLASLGVALVLSVPGPCLAQEPAVRRLERQLAESPSDTRLLCELGWARFRDDDDPVRAAPLLDRAIGLLGEPTEPPLRRRLAACLYSRGRVHESVGHEGPAIASYERSLRLRANDVVTRRLTDLRAAVAARWPPGELSAPPATDLVRALGAADADDVELFARHLSPDGASEAVLAGVRAQDRIVLAVRERGGSWSVGRITTLLHPNGSETLSLDVGPGPPGRSPTFVVSHQWDNRDCCDEEGYPDWTEGALVYLAWRGGDDAWSVVRVDCEHVRFTANGLIELHGGDSPTSDARARETLR